YIFDGELIHATALHSFSPEGVEAIRKAYPMPASRVGATGRAILTRSVTYIPDVREDPEYRLQGLAQAGNIRSLLSVPMLHDGSPIGAVTVTGAGPDMFSERQIALLKTFAEQAVIAIENTRLFEEVQARTKELQDSLDRQTATSEVLGVISRSPNEV